MTSADTLSIQQAAARAALAVPGVAELPPSLGQRLAGAATSVRRPALAGGIRARPTSGSGGWTVEVRCVLHADHRALDVARAVHDQVHAAITTHLTTTAPPVPVDVTVTITRIAPGPAPVGGAPGSVVR